MSILCEAIKIGEHGACSTDRSCRMQMGILIHSLPVCTTALIGVARQHSAFEPVLMYERIRKAAAAAAKDGGEEETYFLEGVPLRVRLFTGHTSVVLSENDQYLRKLGPDDLRRETAKLVYQMEGLSRPITESAGRADDLGDQVPASVRAFVARCRALYFGIRTVRPDSCFASCSNCNCNRIFYVGDARDKKKTSRGSALGADGDERGEDERTTSDAYWQAAACDRTTEVPSTRRFCSSACREEFRRHVDAAMPASRLELDSDDAAGRHGRTRVPEAFRLALKRNEIAARALRTLRSRPRAHSAVSDEEMDRRVEQRITALNVDLGVLYASMLIAESGTLSRGKYLAGSSRGWRHEPALYARILMDVSRIYNCFRRKEGIVSSLLTMPKYMEHIRTNAHKMVR